MAMVIPVQKIESGDFPPQQAVEHHQGDFIDHGGGNQKGKRDSQRYSRCHESDEKRNCGAGAKGGDNPKQGGQHIAVGFAFSCQDLAGPLHRDKGPDYSHKEHDQQQEHQDLGRVIDEKLDGRSKMAVRGKVEQRKAEPIPKRGEVGCIPHTRRQCRRFRTAAFSCFPARCSFPGDFLSRSHTGRGWVLSETWNSLLGVFANCLAKKNYFLFSATTDSMQWKKFRTQGTLRR